MSVAKDMLGNKFLIDGVLGSFGGVSVFAQEHKRLLQPITVIPGKNGKPGSLRTGTVWRDPVTWKGLLGDMELQEHGLRTWKLIRIADTELLNGNKGKRLSFKLQEQQKMPGVNAYKELLEKLDMSEPTLSIMIKELLAKVFPADALQKLLLEDRLEFILDEFFMYLKAGDSAYRV
jgi:hypothetical protein